MMEKILITGGSGMLGTRLTRLLLKEGYRVAHLGRSRNSRNPVKVWLWDTHRKYIEEGALDGVDYIIHLAGEGIADGKWSDERKRSILRSRIDGPQLLFEKLRERNQRIKGFFSASGINIFDSKSDAIHAEDDEPGKGFVSDVVVQWENSAHRFDDDCRVVCFRFGMLLDRNDGAIPRIGFPVQFGLGAAVGSGKQWTPWLHAEDAARCFVFGLKNENLKGNFNAVAPQHITNMELTKALGRAMKMPVFLPNVPAFFIRMAFGEMSQLVLEGSRASSEKLVNSGFTFLYPDIDTALHEVYS
jgi:uncharacterized protein